jgi:hypothetical protein
MPIRQPGLPAQNAGDMKRRQQKRQYARAWEEVAPDADEP